MSGAYLSGKKINIGDSAKIKLEDVKSSQDIELITLKDNKLSAAYCVLYSNRDFSYKFSINEMYTSDNLTNLANAVQTLPTDASKFKFINPKIVYYGDGIAYTDSDGFTQYEYPSYIIDLKDYSNVFEISFSIIDEEIYITTTIIGNGEDINSLPGHENRTYSDEFSSIYFVGIEGILQYDNKYVLLKQIESLKIGKDMLDNYRGALNYSYGSMNFPNVIENNIYSAVSNSEEIANESNITYNAPVESTVCIYTIYSCNSTVGTTNFKANSSILNAGFVSYPTETNPYNLMYGAVLIKQKTYRRLNND